MVRGTPDRARQQIADPSLENLVGGNADRIFDPLGLQELVDPWHGTGRVGAEIEAQDLAPIACYDRGKHVVPAVGAVHVAGAKRASFHSFT